MNGVNKAIIIGRLGQDPETRATPQGTSVTTLSVATSESWKDKQTGEKKEATEWHRVVFWGRLAEVAGQYLRKGAPIYVEGKLVTRKWEDKKGVTRWTTEIVGREMQMLGSRKDSESQDTAGPPAANAGSTANQVPGQQPTEFEDDDTPF